MTINAKRDLQIRYMNVITTFFYKLLDEDVCINQSHMSECERNDDKDLVYKFKKVLYELTQVLNV